MIECNERQKDYSSSENSYFLKKCYFQLGDSANFALNMIMASVFALENMLCIMQAWGKNISQQNTLLASLPTHVILSQGRSHPEEIVAHCKK